MSTDGGTLGGSGYGITTDEELRRSLVDALEREGALKVRVAELAEGGESRVITKAKEQVTYLGFVHTGLIISLFCTSILIGFRSFGDLAAIFMGEGPGIGQQIISLGVAVGLILALVACIASTWFHVSIRKALDASTSR